MLRRLFAKAIGKPVTPGEYVKLGVKDTYIQVGSDIGALNVNEYKRLGWDKLFDPKKVMIAPEHCGSWTRPQDSISNRRIPPPNQRVGAKFRGSRRKTSLI